MNYFIQKIVEDIKSFSAELLAPGLNTTQLIPTGGGTVANTTALLHSIDFLTNLLPKLIIELENTLVSRKVSLHYGRSPKGARLSQRASDYQHNRRRGLLPSRWCSVLPEAEPDLNALRWLLYLLELQKKSLAQVQTRTTKYIDDSLLAQSHGTSSYAQSDRATLLGMNTRLEEAQSKLAHARVAVLRSVPIKFSASPILPNPFPQSDNWQRLRAYAQHLIHPKDHLPSMLKSLLHGDVEIADTPYLYQRWCGIKLLQAFEKLGWQCQDDPVGALFLGGEIQLKHQKTKISVWVEPRFVRHQVHPSGFICREVAETHPDYFIVTSGARGIDAFILDPTTTSDSTIRENKGKYLNTIEAETMLTVAGIPLVRNPQRAWSAAPLHTPHCEIEDFEGRMGTIPMHPLDWSMQPLLAWVNDIHDHAVAWDHIC